MEICKDFVRGLLERLDLLGIEVPIPLFSLEGIAGSGKTTQIERCRGSLERQGRRGFYFELPTNCSPYGRLMSAFYKDKGFWPQFASDAWWFNPLFILLDIRERLKSLQYDKYDYMIMSRGIISTYIYNFIPGATAKESIDKLHPILDFFPRAKVLFYLELPVEIAHARVIRRNREPLREMDTLVGMKKNIDDIKAVCQALKLDLHTVNADSEIDTITEKLSRSISELI